MTEDTTLNVILDKSKTLIRQHTLLVQFIYENFGETGISSLEDFTLEIGKQIQLKPVTFVSKDGNIELSPNEDA